MIKFAVRRMQPDDIQAVQEVARTSWNATYNGIIPGEIQDRFLKFAYSDEMLRRRMERSILYVAEVSGRLISDITSGESADVEIDNENMADVKIAGFANFSKVEEGGNVELSALYVHPIYQGKGIGSALLNEGIAHSAHSQGVSEINVNVEQDNVLGRRFYEAKNFGVVDEFDDDFDGHILRTIRMVLKLTT